MRRYIILLALIVVFTMNKSSDVLAASYISETVFDYANLLTSKEEDELRNLSKDYELYNMSAIFLTTSDAEGMTSERYSDEFYNTNHFKPDGVLFFVDMDNREIYVNTVGKGIAIVSDYEVEEILDAGYSHVKNEEYFECLQDMSDYTYQLVGSYDESRKVGADIQQSKPAEMFLTILLGCVPAPMIVMIVLLVKHRKANRQISAENYMGANFRVKNKNVAYMGCRREVLQNYYKKNNTNNGMGGGSSHWSPGGISHGGGGRKF